MITYLLRRLFSAILVLWGVVTLTFFAIRLLPGDPATLLISQGGGSAADIARLQAELGLDRPILAQYFVFLINLLRGNLGESLTMHRPVSAIIAEQLPHTATLAITATLASALLGGTLGSLAALHRNTWIDRLSMALSTLSVSTPILLSGLLLMILLSLTLGWLPATGQGSWKHLIMPTLVLALSSMGSIARLVRAQLIEVLWKDYITVARSKGLAEPTIFWRHAMRNAMIPVMTVLGLRFGAMLGGTVVTESLFSRRGLGRLLVDAISWKDYPLVQGTVLVAAAFYIAVNILVDWSYGLLDPRIRED